MSRESQTEWDFLHAAARDIRQVTQPSIGSEHLPSYLSGPPADDPHGSLKDC
jgi:hypothetical protein